MEKPLAHFYVKTEISEDFHIRISVPLMKERKQPPVVILQQAILQSIFILFLCLRIIGTSDQDVQFMNFPSHIFFNDINHGYRATILRKNSLWLLPFYKVVATYFYYEKVRRSFSTNIVCVNDKLFRNRKSFV